MSKRKGQFFQGGEHSSGGSKQKKACDMYSKIYCSDSNHDEPVNAVNGVQCLKNWSVEDMRLLLSRMKDILPANDSMKYSTRAQKLDWEAVSFGNHLGESCKEMWYNLQSRIRKYRVLSELLQDAESFMNDYKCQEIFKPHKPESVFRLVLKEMKKRNKGVSAIEIMKQASEKIKTLSEEELMKYKEEHDQLTAKYLADMQQYHTDHPSNTRYKLQSKSKKRHPDEPSRPLSKYMIFYVKESEKLKREQPYLKRTDRTRILSEAYNNLSPKEVKKLDKKARKLREEYLEKLDEFYSNHPELKPKSPDDEKNFQYYCDRRLERKVSKVGDVEDVDKDALVEACRIKWCDMSHDQRMKWKLKRERKEIQDYVAVHGDAEVPDPPELSKENYKTWIRKCLEEGKSLQMQAYQVFVSVMFSDPERYFKGVPNQQRLQEIARRWKYLVPGTHKEIYKQFIANLKQEYENLSENEKNKVVRKKSGRKTKTSNLIQPKEPFEDLREFYGYKCSAEGEGYLGVFEDLSDEELQTLESEMKLENKKRKKKLDFYLKNLSNTELRRYYEQKLQQQQHS